MNGSHVEQEAFEEYLRRPVRRRMARVVHLLHGHVWDVALRLAGNEVDAADLSQEVFLSLILRPPAPGSVRSPRGYLTSRVMTITRNRRQSAERRRIREVEAAQALLAEGGLPRDDIEAVREAIEGLPERVRSAVELRYIGGLKNGEIAEALGISEPSVEKDLQRGREILRGKLGKDVLATLAVLAGASEASAAPPNWLLPDLLRIADVGGVLRPLNIATLGGALAMKKTIAIAAALLVLILLSLVGPWSPFGRVRDEAAGRPTTSGQRSPTSVSVSDVRKPVRPARAEDRNPLTELGKAREKEAAPDEGTEEETGSLLIRLTWEDDGAPASGVGVRVLPGAAGNPFIHGVGGVTGDDGTLLVEDLPGGSVPISIDRSGFPRKVKVVPGRETEVSFALPGLLEVDGIVVDEKDNPVEGADVWLSEFNTDNIGGSVVTRTGPDGTFRLRGVETGRYIAARAKGHAPSSGKFVQGNRGEREEVRLVLPGAGGAIRGRVIDSRGVPVPGAVLMVGSRGFANGSHVASPPPVRVFVEEDGAFEVDGLAPGDVPVAARAPGLAPAEVVVTVEAGVVPSIDLVLGPGATLRGKVVGPDGRPMDSVMVQAGSGPRVTFLSDILHSQIRTGLDGEYLLTGLPAGKMPVRVDAGERGNAEDLILLRAGEEVRRDFVLSAGLEIAGQVLSEDDEPLAGCLVLAGLRKGGIYRNTPTDRDGRFRLKPCDDGEWFIEVTERGCSLPSFRKEGVRPGAESLTIRLEEKDRPRSRLTGKVVGPDGRSLSGARVLCLWDREASNRNHQVKTGLLGGFETRPVPAGTYEVSVESDGLPKTWIGKHPVGPGETVDLGTIVLPRPGFLKETVRRTDGKRIDDLILKVTDADGRVPVHVVLSNEPDRRDPLAPGTHRLEVRGKDIETFSKEIEVREGEETTIEVELKPGSGSGG